MGEMGMGEGRHTGGWFAAGAAGVTVGAAGAV